MQTPPTTTHPATPDLPPQESFTTATSQEHQNEITHWPENQAGYSPFTAYINLVKGGVGCTLVFVPYAAGNAGLILSFIILFIIAAATAHTTELVGKIMLMARSLCRRLGLEEFYFLQNFDDLETNFEFFLGFW